MVSAARIIAATRLILFVAGAAFSLVAGWGSPLWWAPFAVILGVALAERASVRIVVGRQAVAFALNDAIVAVALVLAPGSWIAFASALGYAAARARNLPLSKLSFNLAHEFGTVSAGVLVAQLIGNGVTGAAFGLAAYAVLSILVVAIPVAATTGLAYHRVLGTISPLAFIHTAGNASVGLLAGWLVLHAPWGLLSLVVPIGLLWWSYSQQTRRASEARLYAELARGQERMGGSADSSTEVVLTAAARLFGGAEVELLLRHPDGLLRYVGDETGVLARMRVDADAFDAPWVLRALAARGVLVGQDGARPYCSAVLGDPERPGAVLIAYRPEKSLPFTRADVELAEVLAGQAGSWLSVAELSARRDEAIGRAEAYGAANRVLGDMSQQTVPALAVLRESAHRLSRLATRFDGPDAVDEIVAELYSVERAVASLLGAIALASDSTARPALTADPAAPGRGGEAEWTTTGRLEDADGL
ncbi:MAG: hypothetical protein AVDCRST_MAG41-1781 [uncultured Corynebacteriales bacterium]|uniref:Uncharacterized protein n=1 Tax=uncultured Mycobacteriales bacterium TaxID=581187 RepID=A0A6J4IB91_9ACTN|nr:MAG: hypothetical protein AVDCRST_MAG41-1781 [uncultured Corynebacteriales bacterium]